MRSRPGRGQVLVLAALTISLAILSTQAYIYQRSRTEASADWSALSDYVLSIEQGSRHVVVASLINVSRGGASSNLGGNLDRWEPFVGGDYRFGRCDLNATVASQSPYSDGVWLNWGIAGKGVSSAYADFIMNLSGRGVEVDWSFYVNASTIVLVSGNWERVSANETLVTVIINLLTEGEPALAGDIILADRHGYWRDPSVLPSYSWLDYGNGTYKFSFTDNSTEDQERVRTRVYDRRDIFVEACLRGIPYFLGSAGQGELSKFDNTTWTSTTPPALMGTVLSIDSNVDYWLIGDSNWYVWKYDGHSFTDISPTLNRFDGKISAIGWGEGYWLVGDAGGIIQKYNGTSWTDLTNDAGFYSVGSSIEEIEWNQDFGYWLVGGKKIVKKFDGSTWTDISPSSRRFEDKIGGIGGNGSIWLVGDWSGVVQKFDGSIWTDLTSDANFKKDPIFAIEWGAANSQFLIGGKKGKVKTFDGSSFSDQSIGWGSTKDVYAIGWSDSFSYWLVGGETGLIKSFDGSSWTDRTSDAGFSGDVMAIRIELYG